MVLAAYLGGTVPLLALGGLTPLRLVVLALHICAVPALLRLSSRRQQDVDGRFERVLVDWAPLILVPALYGELPLLMEGLAGTVQYHDPAIARLARTVFGAQPAFPWAGGFGMSHRVAVDGYKGLGFNYPVCFTGWIGG